MIARARQHAVAAAYDADAAFYAASFPTTEPEQNIDLATIDHWVHQLRRKGITPSVLDAGCGAGRMSRYLMDRGCHVTGIDLSSGLIGMARRDHPQISTSVGSIMDLPYPDATFDAVFYWYSIIHLPQKDLPRAFAEARRVLKPGGSALFAFQTGTDARDVAGGSRRRGHDVTLIRYHRSPDAVSQLLSSSGLVESMRMTRNPCDAEKDGQAVLIFERDFQATE